MSSEAWVTLKVLFGEEKANQILMDAIKKAQNSIISGDAWQCGYCKRINAIGGLACAGCQAPRGEKVFLSLPARKETNRVLLTVRLLVKKMLGMSDD